MNNKTIIQILLLALFLVSTIFGIAIYGLTKKIRKKNRDAIFVENSKFGSWFLYSSFRFFSRFYFSRFYIGKIRRRYEIIHPDNIRKVGELTMITAYRVWLISLLLIAITCSNDPGFYMIVITGTLIYLLNSYFMYQSVNKQEIKLLKQIEQFLPVMRHHYYKEGNVSEALDESIQEINDPISTHVEKILEILALEEDLDESKEQYHDIAPNRFLTTFLALCISILKFGDRKVEGQSLFLHNLTSLREEIGLEIRKREKINQKFSGLPLIAIVPMYSLGFIKNWASGLFEGMEMYYEGAYGIIAIVIICGLSLLVYQLIITMKETDRVQKKEHYALEWLSELPVIKVFLTTYMNRNYGKTLQLNDLLHRVGESITVKEFYLQRVLYSLGTFFLGIMLIFGIHSSKKQLLLYYTDNLITISASASSMEAETIKEIISRYTEKYKNIKNVNELEETLQDEIKNEDVFWSKQIMTMTVEEVMQRVKDYQKEYFKWWELLVVIILTVAAHQIPYWMLLINKKIMERNMEDEIIQYQTIILMLMHIERVSTHDILSWIENFAVIFRSSIEECLNDFSKGETEALTKLRETESFEPFQRLVDNLLMCDRIGIKKAFDEVSVERKNYQEKRRQENDFSIDEKAAVASILAFAPFSLVVGLYVIVPLVIESLSQLFDMLDQFQL